MPTPTSFEIGRGFASVIRKHARLFTFVAMAAMLSACGGGGSSGSGSTGTGTSTGGTAQLVVSPAQINVSAQLTDPAPTASIQVSVQVSSTADTQTKYYIEGGNTSVGIASVTGSPDGDFDDITVTFKVPQSLGAGTYNDTITLKGCVDQPCSSQVSNSPQTVSVTYVVTQGPSLAEIYSISPNMATAGAAPFTLTLSGSGFTAQSSAFWNGSALVTTFVSSNQLTAQVPASDVSASGTYSVTASDGSGGISNGQPFTVAALVAQSLSKISPVQVAAGGSGFKLTAIGTGFTSAASIAWNGTSLATTYLSGTMIQANITAAQIASTGTVAITVLGGSQGNSGPISLTIVPPNVDAVAYQMNSAHTGGITFKNMTLPANSAWSVDVGGNPSYALIVGGQVIVSVSINGGSQLLALNGANGATVWGPIAFSGNANASYDGGRVFVTSGDTLSQIITALDVTTGNSVWSATVPGEWFPEPTVAADGIVYTTNGGYVSAFDETAGAILWQAGIGGTDGIVTVTPDGLYGASPCTALDLQPTTGATLWYNNSGCDGGGGATPVAANGLVYAPDGISGSSGTIFDSYTGATKGSYSASVIPAFSSSAGFFLFNGTLQGIAQSNNQVLWSFAGDGQLATAPIVVNNYVFIGSQSGNIYALDAGSGQQQWSNNLGAAIPANDEFGNGIYTGLAAGDGLLVVPAGTKVTAFVLSTNP